MPADAGNAERTGGMKAILMSDSHGDAAGVRWILQQAWARTGQVDAYFHMGDGVMDFRSLEAYLLAHDPEAKLYCVRGNCDFYAPNTESSQVVTFGGARIFMTHGHHFQVKTTLELLDEEADSEYCTIALYGHTHQPAMDMGRTLMINPGSAQDGRIGFLEVSDGRPRIQLWKFE